MALKLPGAEDLGAPVSGRSGRPIASFDGSAIGRGMAQAGQGMRALGAGLKVREKTQKKDVDQATAFDTQSRYLQFEDQQRKAFADSILNAPVGAEGFSAAQKEAYQSAAREFFKTVPDELKPEYNQALFKLETNIVSKADTFAVEEKDRVAKTKIEDGANVILQGLQDNPESWRDADAKAESLIKNSDRTKIDQDEDLRAWRKRRAEALWDIDRKTNGGAARERLGIGGPIKPMPADVQSRANMARDHFVKLGYSPAQAAGIVGNLVQESGVRSDGAVGDSGTAFGMAQWRGERFTRLKRFAASRGKDWKDFTTQLDYIDMELKNHETDAYRRLMSAQSVDEATAAFISYERPQGWTTANPRGGHGWANRLAAAQRTAGEEVNVSEVAPEYADLPYEDRVKLFDHSVAEEEKTAHAAAVQANAQRKAFTDAMSLGIETGSVVSRQEILDANAAGRIDDGSAVTLLKQLDAKMKDGAAVSALTADILAGSPKAAVNSFDEEQRKVADKTYDAMMQSAPDDQKGIVTDAFVRATGYIPKPAQAVVRQGALSSDPGILAAAMSQADALQLAAPTSFEAFAGGTDVRTKLSDFRHFVNDLGMSGQEAAAEMLRRNDPAVKINREMLKTEADKFMKTLSLGQVTDAFDPGLFAFEPGAGIMPEQQNGLLAEYKELAAEAFYATGGDAGRAKARALDEIKTRWNVSNISGSAHLMRMPPELHYPSVGGSHEYLRADAKATAQGYANDLGRKVENVTIWPSAQTRADIEMGRPPRYRLFYQFRENGQTMFDEVLGPPWGVDAATLDRATNEGQERFLATHTRDSEANEIEREGQDRAREIIDDPSRQDWIKAREAEAEMLGSRFNADQHRANADEEVPQAGGLSLSDDPEVERRVRSLSTRTQAGTF